MNSTLNKIAILLVTAAAFTAAVRYQDQLTDAGNKIETEVVTVSKQTLDSVAVHSDVYKAKSVEAASATAEAAALRKELEKAKEPIGTKVLAWFKR